MVLKASIYKRTLDNITAVMVCFSNFKKVTHPSPIRCEEGGEGTCTSRGLSVGSGGGMTTRTVSRA